MNGATIVNQGPLPVVSHLNWQIVGSGDFDGDGFLDLGLLLAQSSQNLQVGLGDQLGGFLIPASNTNNFSAGGLPPSQVDQFVADFNGDGRLDLAILQASLLELVIPVLPERLHDDWRGVLESIPKIAS